jgi:hypothetical protein
LGEITLRCEKGALTKIETKLRKGGRSLRGETEYGEPCSMVEEVARADEQFDLVFRVDR